eukprot:4133310-Pleurochrysis_carterae.AAC.1
MFDAHENAPFYFLSSQVNLGITEAQVANDSHSRRRLQHLRALLLMRRGELQAAMSACDSWLSTADGDSGEAAAMVAVQYASLQLGLSALRAGGAELAATLLRRGVEQLWASAAEYGVLSIEEW